MGGMFNILQGPLHRKILGDTVMNKLDPVGGMLQKKKEEVAVVATKAAAGPSVEDFNKSVGIKQTFGGS